jgi:hypothetical protein
MGTAIVRRPRGLGEGERSRRPLSFPGEGAKTRSLQAVQTAETLVKRTKAFGRCQSGHHGECPRGDTLHTHTPAALLTPALRDWMGCRPGLGPSTVGHNGGEDVVHHSLLMDDRAVLVERNGQGRVPRCPGRGRRVTR